jgi:hypothetical protein
VITQGPKEFRLAETGHTQQAPKAAKRNRIVILVANLPATQSQVGNGAPCDVRERWRWDNVFHIAPGEIGMQPAGVAET